MIDSISRILSDNVKNIPGWKTKRKLLVLESDDWGSIRTPNKSVYNYLVERGFELGKNNFTKYDTIASPEDLNDLFGLLNSFKDFKGNSFKFTPFVNVSNPNFEKIEDSDFRQYYSESFDHTLSRYYGTEILKKWKEGITANIFVPEYHGKEHYNVRMLVELFRKDVSGIRTAMDKGVVHIPLNNAFANWKGLAATYYARGLEENESLIDSLKSGLDIFANVLGYEAVCFCPPNGVFSLDLEKAFEGSSILGIVADRKRREPSYSNGEFYQRNFAMKFGADNSYGQSYYMRNCKFEPVQHSYSLGDTLNQIDAAFRWGKPAIISSHRINFVSGLEPSMQQRGLEELGVLLSRVCRKYPDVEFMTSSELIKVIRLGHER